MSDNSNSDNNVKIDISASADGMAPGVAQAQGELDKVAGATSEFEKKQRAATESSAQFGKAIGSSKEQLVQLGKEAISGDTARMPETLSMIALKMLPIAAGLAGVTAAIAAGVWAWNAWGDSAEEAAKKAADELKKANDEADRSKHRTTQEQIREKQYRIESLKGDIAVVNFEIERLEQMRRANPSQNREYADKIAEQARLRGAYQRNIENETRNISDLQKPGGDKAAAHQEEIDRTIEREQSKYDRLHQMAVMADSTDAERIRFKLDFDLAAMEKEHNEARRIYGNNATLEKEYQDARLERIAMANAEAERMAKVQEEREEKQRQTKMRSEMSVANFSRLLRQGDYVDAMSMAERMTAGLATKSRAAFEVNKAASLAKATVQGYQMIQAAAADGASWGGYYGAIIEGALAAAYVAANLDAINSTQFGGGGGISTSGGGGVPSQATSPGVPVTPTEPAQQQQLQIVIYNNGTFVDAQQFIDGTVIPQIASAVKNNDVVLIDPRSRQAQMLGA